MNPMRAMLWVAAGSAAGGVLRVAVGELMAGEAGSGLVLGTLIVNIAGSLLIGWFVASTEVGGRWQGLSTEVRTLVTTGLCGGFTTFSFFSIETLLLAQSGMVFAAVGNVVLTVCGCLLAVAAGYSLARRAAAET